MSVIDLTHPIAPDMPVYPGTQPPRIRPACTLDQHGFAETELSFFSHVGTHVDAPAHLLPDGPALDALPASHFFGPACVLDFTHHSHSTIQLDDVKPYKARVGKSEFVLLNTGWSRLWGEEQYFEGFPTLSTEAAEWLAAFPLKGIGVDAISVDPLESEGLPIHKTFLKKGIVIVENLFGLDELPAADFRFLCLPLKFTASDGAPTRAVALLE